MVESLDLLRAAERTNAVGRTLLKLVVKVAGQRALSAESACIEGCASSEVLRQLGFGFSGELASSGIDI